MHSRFYFKTQHFVRNLTYRHHFCIENYPGKRPQIVCVSVHLREAKLNSHDICSRISASTSICKISLRISVWGSFWTTCIKILYLCIRVLWTAYVRILYDHLCKISVSGSFWTTVSGSCWTTVSGSYWITCARSVLGSLYEDPLDHLYQNLVAELVQDLCFKLLLIIYISLFKISYGPLVSSLKSTYARSLFQDPFDHFYEDPVRPLLQDLSMRILYGHLCKISVSGSLSFWTTYQDPVVALVQNLCLRISESGSFWTTCIRIL